MKDEEEVRKEILAAARIIIRQYGISKPTMQDVAKAAGKGKSTLYYYFKSKDEIFDAVISEELKQVFVEVKAAVDKAKKLEDKLKNYLLTKVNLLKMKQNHYRVLIENESHYFDIEHYFTLNAIQNNEGERNLMRSILKTGVEEGQLDKSIAEGADGDLVVEIFMTFIKGLEMEVCVNKDFKLIDEKARMMTRVLINGLR